GARPPRPGRGLRRGRGLGGAVPAADLRRDDGADGAAPNRLAIPRRGRRQRLPLRVHHLLRPGRHLQARRVDPGGHGAGAARPGRAAAGGDPGPGPGRRHGGLHRLLDRAGHAVLLGDRGGVAGDGGHPDLDSQARRPGRRRAAAPGDRGRTRRRAARRTPELRVGGRGARRQRRLLGRGV
ncbi:MAG: hypothetical protein AVDCRST_MAG04-2702, partial [uncultured Acetobacteraceae bacterium]